MAGQDDYSDFPTQPRPYQLVQLGGGDYSDFPTQPQQQEQSGGIGPTPTWVDNAIIMGLKTIPAVGGSLVGGLFGGIPGAAAGGVLGGGLGSTLGQMYETAYDFRPEGVNPYLVATDAALNAIPFFGKAPGLGATAQQMKNYAVKLPFSGAAQGAVQGALGTYPSHWAETGDFSSMPPMESVLANTGMGAAFGGALTVPSALKANRLANAKFAEPPASDWNMPGTGNPPVEPGQRNIPGFGNFTQPPTPPPPPDIGGNYPLRFNEGWVSQPDDMATHPDAIRPGLGEPAPPIQQTRPPTATDMYGMDPATGKPNVIIKKLFKPGELGYWLKNGYINGGTNPDGLLYVVRQGFEDPFKAPAGQQPVMPGTEMPAPPTQAPVSPEVQGVMDRLRAAVQQNAEARQAPPGGSDDVAFERFFGDEGGRVLPGEQTGRVAPFLPAQVEADARKLRFNVGDEQQPPIPPEDLQRFNDEQFGSRPDLSIPKPGDPQGINNPPPPGHRYVTDPNTNLLTSQTEPIPPGTPDPLAQLRQFEQQFRGELEGSLPAGSGARAMDIAAGRPVMDPRMAQRMQGNEWDFTQPQGPVQQGLPIPLALRQQNRLAEIADVQANTVPDPNQGNLFEDITNPVRTEDMEPSFERAGDEFPVTRVPEGVSGLTIPKPTRNDIVIFSEMAERIYTERLLPYEEVDFQTIIKMLRAYPDIARRNGINFEDISDAQSKLTWDIDVRTKGLEATLRDKPTEQLQSMAEELTNDISMIKGLTKGPISPEPERTLRAILSELNIRGQSDEPSYAVMPGGGYKASMNVDRGVINITKDYTSPLPAIQSREGAQNALDAADKLGTAGKVKIRLDDRDPLGKVIEVYDNGGGMDDATLGGKLFEAFSTGKEGEEGATGGKGIGSASYIYGGKQFEIESIADDLNDLIHPETKELLRKADGKRYRITTSGTPEEFLKGTAKFDRTEVNKSTPTGSTMKVVLKDDHDIHDATKMVDKIVENTRNRASTMVVDKYGTSRGTPLKEIESDPPVGITEHKFEASKDDKMIGDFTTTKRNSQVQVLIPKDVNRQARMKIEIHYLNNGMYQFSEEITLPKMADDVPERVLIDIHPLVDDQDDLYPFINTREDIKKDIREEVSAFVKKNISNPALDKRKNRTQELYDSMAPVAIPGVQSTRKTVIYDPGNRFTPDEMTSIQNSPTVKALVAHYHSMIDEILASANMPDWADKLEGVGLMFDRGDYNKINGIHIPNPTTGKSTILFNPFHRIEVQPPRETAWRGTITGVHEVAHIGREHGMTIEFRPEDMSDPRLGDWFQYYMEQLVDHGDVGMFRDTGHKMDFAHRLGYAYAKFGIDATHRSAAAIESILTGGAKSGSYSPEIQRLLHLYQESRGRPDVTEDILSGTGVKQADRGPSTEGNIPSNRQANRNGATPTEESMSPAARRIVEQARAGGRGGFTPPPKPPTDMGGGEEPQMPTVRKKKGAEGEEEEKTPNWRNWLNLPRAATTIMDLSAPLRQGLPLIARKEWWTSWKQQFQALGSEGAFQKTLSDIKNRELFRDGGEDPITKKPRPSLAKRAGLAILNAGDDLTAREESAGSQWIETGQMISKVPGAQKLYQKTLGRAARATNRAYQAYLNQLRADTFENLMKDAQNDFLAGTKGARDPFVDITYAKEIADFVNTATGRGPLRVSVFGEKEHDFEQSAKILSDTLFSPRLMASRVRMLSPATYMMASPLVRKQYIKSLLSVAGASGTMSALAAMAGADVETDLTSADFGKIRIGNTRLDTAGGFQQYLVAASRLISGKTTSSGTGQVFELGQGYRAETRKDVAERFATNKLQPVVKFAYDLAFASQYQPFHVGDRMIQSFIPLIVQDVVELAKENPALIPGIMPLVAAGMGTQTYGKGESISKFISSENDWLFTGGAPQNEIPNLWDSQE